MIKYVDYVNDKYFKRSVPKTWLTEIHAWRLQWWIIIMRWYANNLNKTFKNIFFFFSNVFILKLYPIDVRRRA